MTEAIQMTWVRRGEPLWDELSSRWASELDIETNKPRGKRPPAIFSQHVAAEEGPGWFFRTSWIVDIRSRQDEMWRQPRTWRDEKKTRESR
jgi:hypothetical protein